MPPIYKGAVSPCTSCCSLGEAMESHNPLSAFMLQQVLRVDSITSSTVGDVLSLCKETFQPAIFPSENLNLVPHYH